MKHTILHIVRGPASLLLLTALLTHCEIQENFEYTPANTRKEIGVDVLTYIQTTDSLSLLNEAIQLTGLQDQYTGDAEKTFIIPWNTAFRDFLEDHHYARLTDVPVPILRNLLLYHMVDATVSFDDPALMDSNNPIAYHTGNGQIMYLSHNSNFQGIVNEGTNRSTTITTSNITATNGVLHVTMATVYFHAMTPATTGSTESVQYDTIYATQDTYINAGPYVDVNYGADGLLRVKDYTGASEVDRKIYLMFDTHEFTKEGTVSSVKLVTDVVFTAAKGLSMDVYPVANTDWDEMTLTWNNAPAADADPVASIVTSSVSQFVFDCTSYMKSISTPEKISLMIACEAGGDETNNLASKENTSYVGPMMVARLASGNSTLAAGTNTGLTVAQGGSVVISSDELEATGPPEAEIIYTLESLPTHGWLFMGGAALEAGDTFSQLDLTSFNVVYIHDGSDTVADEFSLSVKDLDGGALEAFAVGVMVD